MKHSITQGAPLLLASLLIPAAAQAQAIPVTGCTDAPVGVDCLVATEHGSIMAGDITLPTGTFDHATLVGSPHDNQAVDIGQMHRSYEVGFTRQQVGSSGAPQSGEARSFFRFDTSAYNGSTNTAVGVKLRLFGFVRIGSFQSGQTPLFLSGLHGREVAAPGHDGHVDVPDGPASENGNNGPARRDPTLEVLNITNQPVAGILMGAGPGGGLVGGPSGGGLIGEMNSKSATDIPNYGFPTAASANALIQAQANTYNNKFRPPWAALLVEGTPVGNAVMVSPPPAYSGFGLFAGEPAIDGWTYGGGFNQLFEDRVADGTIFPNPQFIYRTSPPNPFNSADDDLFPSFADAQAYNICSVSAASSGITEADRIATPERVNHRLNSFGNGLYRASCGKWYEVDISSPTMLNDINSGNFVSLAAHLSNGVMPVDSGDGESIPRRDMMFRNHFSDLVVNDVNDEDLGYRAPPPQLIIEATGGPVNPPLPVPVLSSNSSRGWLGLLLAGLGLVAVGGAGARRRRSNKNS